MSELNSSSISAWLEAIGLAQYAEVFAENDITFETLAALNADDLRELGVTSLGHRKKLLAEIAKLASAPAPKAATVERDLRPPSSEPPKRPAEIERVEPKPPVAPRPVQVTPAIASQPAEQTRPEVAFRPAASPVVVPPQITITTPAVKRPGVWARLVASKFFFISIVVHLLFGVGATYFIVQRIQAKRKVTFQGGPPSTNPSKRALEHKVSMAQKKKTGGAPPQAKRIVTAGLAKISLPEMPAITTATNVVPGMMAGMGGQGFGTGVGFGSGMGSGMGGGGGGGGGFSFFGFRGSGVGLVGTFYDFKRDEQGKPTGVKRGDRPTYTSILKSFTNGSTWAPPQSHKHFTSKARLGAKAFLFPAIADSEAGDAFQSPEAGAAMWVAHYTGSVTPSASGTYRFVGWGDNVMIVGWNGRVVLDASDIGYVDKSRTNEGSVRFPKKGGTPLLGGEWFSVTAGSPVKVDILLGDEGGIFCAGLHIQKKGEDLAKNKNGIPELPLFMTAPLGAEEKKLYGAYLDAKSFSGPVFSARGGGTGSLLDALKRP